MNAIMQRRKFDYFFDVLEISYDPICGNFIISTSDKGQLCDLHGKRFQYEVYESKDDNTLRYEGIANVGCFRMLSLFISYLV